MLYFSKLKYNMIKKINSVVKFNTNNFKLKIGTVNKKNPEVVYIEMGTYIKPNSDKDSFSEYIDIFNKKTKYFINNLIINKKTCNNNFILITDIADERIVKGKKSYLDLQILLKPFNLNNHIFKNLATNIYNDYAIDILTFVKNELENNDIECYKTKK